MNENIKTNSSQINQKFLIKRILLFIMQDQNETLMKKLALLARVTTILYNIDGKPVKLKDSQCFKCKEKIENKLVYLLHLELVHNEEINISRYQFSNDKLTIFIQQKQSSNIPEFIVQIQDNPLILLNDVESRYRNIINRVAKKFKKNQEKSKRKYYHSIDIFKSVGTQSQDEDSQNEIGYIERDLEKNRIGQFVDVNQHQKLLFQIWNDLVHQSKKINKLISHQEIKQILMKFAVAAKKKGLKRPNVLVHTWALWSFGKIIDQDIIRCLYIFDNTEI